MCCVPFRHPDSFEHSLTVMQTIARPNDVLLFHCGYCNTELSVPLSMQGVEGPCPTCQQIIKAPEGNIPMLKPGLFFPPARREETPPPSHPQPGPPPQSWQQITTKPAPVHPEGGSNSLSAEFYQDGTPIDIVPRCAARLDIPGIRPRMEIPHPIAGLIEPRRREKPISKKLDKAAANFLESSFFRTARVAVLVILGGACAGIFLYMKDRQWVIDLPWRPATPGGTVKNRQAAAVSTPTPAPAHPLPDLSDAPLSDAPLSGEEENPLLVEDGPGADGVSPPVILTPMPVPGSVPSGATRIPSSEN